MIREIRAWLVVAWRLLVYFSYRLGLCKRPHLMDVYPEVIAVLDRLFKWPKRLRVEGAEHCPRVGPVVFSGNHFAKEDPFIMYRAIHRICNGAYPFRYMMRDDFFKSAGGILKSRILDVDELTRLLGSLQISRDRVQLTQLKPFIALLREGGAFVMYPGRSRSRTGVFIEYRDGIDEPGGVTFLIAQAQRNRPDLTIPAVPMARTLNLATKESAIAFGDPLYLPHDADRAAQRDLDFLLIEKMGDLVEINAAHIVAGIVYLHCLHAQAGGIDIQLLERAVTIVTCNLPHRRIDPGLRDNCSGAVLAVVNFFAEKNLVRREGQLIAPICATVLASPPHDTTYCILNPLKHTVNQILHLPDVTAAIEAAAFALFKQRAGTPA